MIHHNFRLDCHREFTLSTKTSEKIRLCLAKSFCVCTCTVRKKKQVPKMQRADVWFPLWVLCSEFLPVTEKTMSTKSLENFPVAACEAVLHLQYLIKARKKTERDGLSEQRPPEGPTSPRIATTPQYHQVGSVFVLNLFVLCQETNMFANFLEFRSELLFN